jgi:hypothetical protein
VLRSLLPAGSTIRLEADPQLERVDRYGRLLRYLHHGNLNVNLELVRRGAATVWFYNDKRGRYADQLLAVARRAREQRLGMRGSCQVRWDATGPATSAAAVHHRGPPCPRSQPRMVARPETCPACRSCPRVDKRLDRWIMQGTRPRLRPILAARPRRSEIPSTPWPRQVFGLSASAAVLPGHGRPRRTVTLVHRCPGVAVFSSTGELIPLPPPMQHHAGDRSATG